MSNIDQKAGPLQALSEEYQQLQRDLQEHVNARQHLEAQEQENLGVQAEFNGLDEDSNIYKLVGPVLLKQDRSEALMAVNGRLDFIGKEIKRVENLIKVNQDSSEKKKMEIMQIQNQMQEQEVDGAS